LGKPTKLHVTTPDGIWTSTTEGESWTLHGFPRFFERDKISYCRGVALKRDNPDVIFVGNGDFVPGKTGAIQRSKDGGKTWEAAKLSTRILSSLTAYMAMSTPAPTAVSLGIKSNRNSAKFAPLPGRQIKKVVSRLFHVYCPHPSSYT
jgi:hypothetical protein